MRVAAVCFGLFVLAVVANGQTVSAPETQMKAREITRPSVNRVVAKGGVELIIGTTVITADEADIQLGGAGKVSDIRLTGPVRVKAVLQ